MRQQRKEPRRVKTGTKGIYKRQLADGSEKFEISFTGSDGKRRWKLVPGGIRAAQRERRSVLSRLDRGEKVAPSRTTFEEFSSRWLESQTQLRPRTLESHELMLRVHLNPRIGHLRLGEIDPDRVVSVITSMQAAQKSPATIGIALGTLGRVMGHAARRGLIGSNPVSRLERGERPAVVRREKRILDPDEIAALLAAADDRHRTLLAVAVFAGLRQGEVLGLTWRNIDLEDGTIRVEKQLDRQGRRVAPKTRQAVRDVMIMAALGRTLREHKLRSPFSRPDDLVFCSGTGSPLSARNVAQRGLEAAASRAGINADGKLRLRFHDLRHAYASLLIDQGESIVWISRQLGHASPSITLNVYSHVFARQGERRPDAAADGGTVRGDARPGNIRGTKRPCPSCFRQSGVRL